RMQIVGIAEEALEILEPDEAAREPEGVLDQHRLAQRLRRGPDEEDQGDRELRRDQQVRQRPAGEDDALLHRSATRGESRARGRPPLHPGPARREGAAGAAAALPLPRCGGGERARSTHYWFACWNLRSSSLPRRTASSSACF